MSRSSRKRAREARLAAELAKRDKLSDRQALLQNIFIKHLYPLLTHDNLYRLGATCYRQWQARKLYLELSRASCLKKSGEYCTCIDCKTERVYAHRETKILKSPSCLCTICHRRRTRGELSLRQNLMQEIFIRYLFPLLTHDELYRLGATCFRHWQTRKLFLELSRESCVKKSGENCLCIDCKTERVYAYRATTILNPPLCLCTICHLRRTLIADASNRRERKRLLIEMPMRRMIKQD